MHCNQTDALYTRMDVCCHQTVVFAFLVIAPGLLNIASGWVYIAPGWIYIATGQMYNLLSPISPFLMPFSVCCLDGVDAQGHITTITHCLVPDSVTLAPGYDAMQEDPNIYKTTDLCRYAAPRQFSDMQLPVPGTPAPARQASPPRSPIPATGEFIPDHLIAVMQCMHDEQMQFLKPLERDPVLTSGRKMRRGFSTVWV